jgi:hypothetical protein
MNNRTAVPKFRMPKWSIVGFLGSVGMVGLAGAIPQTQQLPEATPDQAVFFEAKVRPVLAENCYPCHGATSQNGELRLDTAAGILKGGSSGEKIITSDPTQSILVKAVHQSGSLKMPPGKKLKDEEIAGLEAWIKMGAPWPKTTSGKKPPLWSLQPVKNPTSPKVVNVKWVKNPIDAFILAKLEAAKLTPAAEADRRTLIRRLSYDLIGLPPKAAEVETYVGDKAPDAYEKVVDRLLASPQYGERWARHWLDVARYADTKGYVGEADRSYPNAYTYRDWVINAFNRDLPFDQFITQQLAADLMPVVQTGDDKTPLAALGFLNVGRKFINSRVDIIDDQIDVTMRGFEGFTVVCARCHDHKFDPIPTQDYYSLYAVFDSTQEATAPISDKSIREPWVAFNEKATFNLNTTTSLVRTEIAKLRAEVATPSTAATLSNEVKRVLQATRPEVLPEGTNLSIVMDAFDPVAKSKVVTLQKELIDLKKTEPQLPEFAMAMQDSSGHDGVVFKRGNPGNHGDPAPRRFLLALSKLGQERAHGTKGSGRLDLAKSIASKENPLTARVFVNRVWQDHFGSGIVRTPSDFGHQGEKPTHPELLDFLATSFMSNGWSVKKLQKLIVMSATYRQSSAVNGAQYNADPENRLVGHMNRRRLDLEQLRDSLFLASGHLDLSKVGGKSVDLWSTPYTSRRAAYGYIERQNLPGIFRTFDFATPDITSSRRFATTVPQQALFFMNSPMSIEQAKAVSQEPAIQNAQDDGQRIRRLYQLLFARLPDPNELSAGMQYLRLGSQAKVEVPRGEWRYGFGEYDAGRKKTTFTPLDYFVDNGYRIGKEFPDPKFGFIIVNPLGGHPGHDSAHAAIRRWIAPANLTVHIEGRLHHPRSEGDGVKGRLVSSRDGMLGEWSVHNSSAQTEIANIVVQKGDTLDFMIDPGATDAFDATEWSPRIISADGSKIWDAKVNFGPPPGEPLTRLVLYAQALMMTNEFLFVD